MRNIHTLFSTGPFPLLLLLFLFSSLSLSPLFLPENTADYSSYRITHVPNPDEVAVSDAPFGPIGDRQLACMQFPLLSKRFPIFLFDFLVLLSALVKRKLCRSLSSGPVLSIPNDLGLASKGGRWGAGAFTKPGDLYRDISTTPTAAATWKSRRLVKRRRRRRRRERENKRG